MGFSWRFLGFFFSPSRMGSLFFCHKTPISHSPASRCQHSLKQSKLSRNSPLLQTSILPDIFHHLCFFFFGLQTDHFWLFSTWWRRKWGSTGKNSSRRKTQQDDFKRWKKHGLSCFTQWIQRIFQEELELQSVQAMDLGLTMAWGDTDSQDFWEQPTERSWQFLWRNWHGFGVWRKIHQGRAFNAWRRWQERRRSDRTRGSGFEMTESRVRVDKGKKFFPEG